MSPDYGSGPQGKISVEAVFKIYFKPRLHPFRLACSLALARYRERFAFRYIRNMFNSPLPPI